MEESLHDGGQGGRNGGLCACLMSLKRYSVFREELHETGKYFSPWIL
jgi:hypothetical protein